MPTKWVITKNTWWNLGFKHNVARSAAPGVIVPHLALHHLRLSMGLVPMPWRHHDIAFGLACAVAIALPSPAPSLFLALPVLIWIQFQFRFWSHTLSRIHIGVHIPGILNTHYDLWKIRCRRVDSRRVWHSIMYGQMPWLVELHWIDLFPDYLVL